MMNIVSPRVPAAYTALEWLGMNYPAKQWINVTGFRFSLSRSFDFDFECDLMDAQYRYGSLWSISSVDNGQEMWTADGYLKCDIGNSWELPERMQIAIGSVTRCRIHLSWNGNSRRAYMEMTPHGGSTQRFDSTMQTLFTNGYLVIGASGLNTAAKARFYSFTIRENGTETYAFVPARRKSDDVVGFFDTVNDGFYVNNGNGSFIAGPAIGAVDAITIPEGDVRRILSGGVTLWKSYGVRG